MTWSSTSLTKPLDTSSIVMGKCKSYYDIDGRCSDVKGKPVHDPYE